MPEYYYDLNGSQAGPIAADQLLTHGVTATTLVWRDGIPDWVSAATIPELSSLFQVVPPPLPPLPASRIAQPSPMTPKASPPVAVHGSPVSEAQPAARPQFSAEASTRKWWHYLIYAVALMVLLLLVRACGAVVGHLISATPSLPHTEFSNRVHTTDAELVRLVVVA